MKAACVAAGLPVMVTRGSACVAGTRPSWRSGCRRLLALVLHQRLAPLARMAPTRFSGTAISTSSLALSAAQLLRQEAPSRARGAAAATSGPPRLARRPPRPRGSRWRPQPKAKDPRAPGGGGGAEAAPPAGPALLHRRRAGRLSGRRRQLGLAPAATAPRTRRLRRGVEPQARGLVL